MTAFDQDSRADFIQSAVADLHAKFTRWFRSENPDLTADEVQAAIDCILLHHVVVHAVNRDRTGSAAVKAMMERFAEAAAAVLVVVQDQERQEASR